jgi:carboxymethylenebutenolidase
LTPGQGEVHFSPRAKIGFSRQENFVTEQNVIEEKVEIRTPDGISDGFLYRPADGKRYPGVIHYTDIGGIRDASQGMARRQAAEGYTVLVPNVFYRTSRPPVFLQKTPERIAELSGPLTADAMARDGAAYVDFLAANDFVRPGKMGAVGYCITGRMALYTAKARPEKIAAAASFHGGGLATDKPDSPHLALSGVKAQLYFGHAINDRGMPPDAIDKLNRALEAWGGQYESELYEGALHSWTVPGSPVYNQPQAERAFKKLIGLFTQTLQ